MGGSNTTISNVQPMAGNLRVQTAVYGSVIPLVYGRTRVSGNLIWFGGFTAIPHTTTTSSGGKGGGGVTQSNTDFTYSAAVIMALGEGVMSNVISAWKGKSKYTGLGDLGLSMATGTIGQPVWGYLTSNYPTQAVAYSGLSYLYAPAYDLGSDAQVPNHTFEVSTPWEQSFSVDADPGAIIQDMLSNGRYGADFPAGKIGSLANVTNYARAQGLLISPVFQDQKPAAEWLQYVLQMANSDCTWSQGVIKFVPLGDSAVTGNGVTYTPNTTPVYDLTEDHYIVGSPNDDGVKVARKSNEDAYNHVRIEYFNRSNDYNVEIVEAKDAADIDQRGIRTASTLEAHAVCDTTAASALATLALGRQMAVRNQYTFKLPWVFGLLEPLDLLTLTYDPKGLYRVPVRINRIDELDTGDFEIVAEDAPIGMATAPAYGAQAGKGFSHDYNVAPGDVTAPALFEAPVQLTTNGLEVFAAVSGMSPNWGGCRVWASLDGLNYKEVDRIVGGARYGYTTAPITATDTSVPVTLIGLGGQMLSGTASDAASLTTLFWIDGASDGGEYMAHQGAVLTGVNAYTLNTLTRSAYSTTAQAHTANATFVRIDDAVGRSGPIDLSYIGKIIYFKFTSINVYGGGEQDLATVTAYSYTVKGGLIQLPPPDVTNFSSTGDLLRWDPISTVTTPDLLGYELRFQYRGNTDWASASLLHTGGVITESQFKLLNRPSGPVTFLLKAIDTTYAYSANATAILTDLGDPFLANVVWTYDFKALGFPGTQVGCSVDGSSNLSAVTLDRFFGSIASQPFFDGDGALFFNAAVYSSMVYTSPTITLGAALFGSNMTLVQTMQTPSLMRLEYRFTGPGIFFDDPANYFFTSDPGGAFFGATGNWMAWPGQVLAENTGYQFRVTLGDGTPQPSITQMKLVVDAPDLVESLNDVPISSSGTVIPYTKAFGAIYNIQATLQANASGGVTVEINKSNPLAPVAYVYNAAHTLVNGATVDFVLKGIGK